MKVLIAEDDSTSAIVLRKALEKLGHDAVVANDGDMAYSLLTRDTEFTYRVVISDWMMPGMDGLELTRKLREERKPGDPYRFVVLLTARGRPEDRRAGLDAGADDFMVKPLDMGDLIPRLSIAERMIALEDAAQTRLSAPAPVAETATATETKSGAETFAALPGEAEARVLLQAAVLDQKAYEIHLEPQASGTYRVRIRVPDGTLRVLETDSATVLQAKEYLLAGVEVSPARTLPIEIAGHSLLLSVERLALRSGYDRLCIRVRYDSAELSSDLTLDDLPMLESTRTDLREFLAEGKANGSLLYITGSKQNKQLITRCLSAIKTELADDTTLILTTNDVALGQQMDYAKSSKFDVGVKRLDYDHDPTAMHRMVDQLGIIFDLIRQEPDVLIAEDISIEQIYTTLGPYSHTVSNRLFIIGYAGQIFTPHSLSEGINTLMVLDPTTDGSNEQDRFRLTLRTNEESKNHYAHGFITEHEEEWQSEDDDLPIE